MHTATDYKLTAGQGYPCPYCGACAEFDQYVGGPDSPPYEAHSDEWHSGPYYCSSCGGRVAYSGPVQSHKFQSHAAQYVYELAMDGAADEAGSVGSTMWVAMVAMADDECRQYAAIGGDPTARFVIVGEDGQGFVDIVAEYATDEAAEAAADGWPYWVAMVDPDDGPTDELGPVVSVTRAPDDGAPTYATGPTGIAPTAIGRLINGGRFVFWTADGGAGMAIAHNPASYGRTMASGNVWAMIRWNEAQPGRDPQAALVVDIPAMIDDDKLSALLTAINRAKDELGL